MKNQKSLLSKNRLKRRMLAVCKRKKKLKSEYENKKNH